MSMVREFGNELRHRKKFYDVIIRVGDRTFLCHRIILASKLEYFLNMFCGGYDETDKKELELKGISADDFELLLTHIYGGSVSFEGDNIYRLLRISNYLCLQNLSDLCEEYIANNCESIPLETVANIFVLANKLERVNLIDKLMKRVAQNLTTVFKEEHLFHISRVQLEKILSHPDVDKNVTTILDFVTNWIKYHVDEGNMLDSVLSKIGLEPALKEWIKNKLMETIVLPDDQGTLNEESGVIHNIDNSSEDAYLFIDENINNIFQVQKNWNQLPFHLYYSVCESENYSVRQYKVDPLNNLHLVCSPFPLTISNLKTSISCKSVFIDKFHYLLRVDREMYQSNYNTVTNITLFVHDNSEEYQYRSVSNYSYAPALSLHRNHENLISSYSAVTALGPEIYMYDYGQFYTFNSETNRWTDLTFKANRPIRMTYPNLVSYNNCLYMIGGHRIRTVNNTPLKSFVEKIRYVTRDGRYFQYCDIREGVWRRLPYMTYGHKMSASSIHNDILYVSGGESSKGYMEYYDFKAGKWGAFQSLMPVVKRGHVQLSYNNKLWFFGGSDSRWYSYDLKENEWSSILPELVLADPHSFLHAEVQCQCV